MNAFRHPPRRDRKAIPDTLPEMRARTLSEPPAGPPQARRSRLPFKSTADKEEGGRYSLREERTDAELQADVEKLFSGRAAERSAAGGRLIRYANTIGKARDLLSMLPPEKPGLRELVAVRDHCLSVVKGGIK